MQTLGTVSIMMGIAVAFLAQIVGAILVFRSSALQGVLSVLVPGYFLFALKRRNLYKPIVGIWFAGILGMVAGTIILS
jgi:hypothetical protein